MVVVFRERSPLLSAMVESCLPEPLRIIAHRCCQWPGHHGEQRHPLRERRPHRAPLGQGGIGLFCACSLPSEIESSSAADQHLVDISLTGITLLNIFWGPSCCSLRRGSRERWTRHEGGHLLPSLSRDSGCGSTSHEFLGPRVLQQVRHILRRGLLMGSRSLPLLRLCEASTAVVGGALYAGADSRRRSCEGETTGGATDSRGASAAGMSCVQSSQDAVRRVVPRLQVCQVVQCRC